MDRVSDILSSSIKPSIARIGKGIAKVEKLNEMEANKQKFESRAEIEKAGLGSRLDELYSIVAYNKQYKNNSILAQSTLDMQKIQLNELNKVIIEFEKNKNTNSLEMDNEDKVEAANKRLLEVEKILNSTDSKGNLYFGGKNNEPLLFSLASKSNLINGTVLSNYTGVSKGETKLALNEHTKVDMELLSANDTGIAKLIAAINLYKDSKGQSKTEIDKFLLEGKKGLSSLQTKVLVALETVKKADEANINIEASSNVVIAKLVEPVPLAIPMQISQIMTALTMSWDIEANINKVINDLEM